MTPSNADVRKVQFNLLDNKKLLKVYEPVSGVIREVLQEDTYVSNRLKKKKIGQNSSRESLGWDVLVGSPVMVLWGWPELGELSWEWEEEDGENSQTWPAIECQFVTTGK